MRRNFTTWLSAAVMTFFAVPAFGQDQVKQYAPCTRTPSESDISAAKGAFRAGEVSFNEADYERAIFYWEDAYRRDCTAHLMLWNLGRAYESQGNKQQAVVALETYLERKPDAPQRDTILRRIDVLKAQIERESQQAKPAEQPASTTSPGGEQQSNVMMDPGMHEPTGEPSSGFPHKPVAIGIMGAGGVLALVGGIIFLNADSDLSEFDEQCPVRTNCSLPEAEVEAANEARSRATLGGVLFGLGVATIGGGLVYYLVAPKREEQVTELGRRAAHARFPEVTPVVGAGFAGLELQGNF